MATGFFVASLVWSIKRMAQNRVAWWVPIVMTALSVSGVVLGYAIAASGVHNGKLLWKFSTCPQPRGPSGRLSDRGLPRGAPERGRRPSCDAPERQ